MKISEELIGSLVCKLVLGNFGFDDINSRGDAKRDKEV